MNYFNDKRLA